jgi:hypothetical protein
MQLTSGLLVNRQIDDVVLDVDLVDRDGCGGGQCQRITIDQAKRGTMAGALNLIVEYLSFGKRGLGVTAPIANGIDVVADTEHSNAVFSNLDA